MVVRVGLAVQWTGGAAAAEDGGGVTVLCCACWAAQHSSEPGLGRGGATAQSHPGSVLGCWGVGCWRGLCENKFLIYFFWEVEKKLG